MQTSQRTPPTRRLLATTNPTMPTRPASVTQDVHFMRGQQYPPGDEKSSERSPDRDRSRRAPDWDGEARSRRMDHMSSEIPARVTTVLFDVGNTLHHLD